LKNKYNISFSQTDYNCIACDKMFAFFDESQRPYVKINASPDLEILKRTEVFYVRIKFSNNDAYTLLNKSTQSNSTGYWFTYIIGPPNYSPELRVQYTDGVGSYDILSFPYDFNDNISHLVVVVYDLDDSGNGTISAYVDGEKIGSYNVTNVLKPPNGRDIYIGTYQNDPYYDFDLYNGYFGFFRLYNRALSEEEVKRLYLGEDIQDGLIVDIDFSEGIKDKKGHALSYSNIKTYVEKTNSGLYFNGSNSYVHVQETTSLNVKNNKHTVVVFAQIEKKPTGKYQKILNKFTTNGGYYLEKSSTSNSFTFKYAGNDGTHYPIYSTYSNPNDNIHCLATTLNGNNMKVFLDGTKKGERNDVSTVGETTNPFIIGKLSGGSTYWYVGTIQKVYVFDEPLDEEEIEDICLGGLPKKKLVLFLDFTNPKNYDGNPLENSKVKDLSYSGNDAFLYNTRLIR